MADMILNSSRLTRRAKTALNRLLAQKKLTPGGLKWLIVALDPFHDQELQCDGYPDNNTNRVITEAIDFQVVVKKPDSVTTAPWDAHIFFLPFSHPLTSKTTLFLNSYDRHLYYPNGTLQRTAVDAADIVRLYSGYNCITLPTGVDWQATAITNAADLTTSPSISMDYDASMGYHRIIGCAFEVVNTTAELYKGGSITTFRCPNQDTECIVKYDVAQPDPAEKSGPVLTQYSQGGSYTQLPKKEERVGAATIAWAGIPFITLPPSTVNECKMYHNSQTMGAAGGIYAVGSLEGENKFVQPLPGTVLLGQTYDSTQVLTNGANATWARRDVLANVAATGICMSQPYDWNTHGCIISGLDANSTLSLNVRYIVEKMPNVAQPEILRLSRCSPSFDPLAQEIYSRAMCFLPCGVPVRDNMNYGWFDAVLDAIGVVAPLVGSAFGPAGGAVGAVAAKVATEALRSRMSNLERSVALVKGKPQHPPGNAPAKRKRRKRAKKAGAKNAKKQT